MIRTILKSKIHRATVTEANLHYMGSITVDLNLLESADIFPYEKVQVVDIDNGQRLETYVIEGPRGSGCMCINGAAARLVHTGDKIIIFSYVGMREEELIGFKPRVVHVNEKNEILSIDEKIDAFTLES